MGGRAQLLRLDGLLALDGVRLLAGAATTRSTAPPCSASPLADVLVRGGERVGALGLTAGAFARATSSIASPRVIERPAAGLARVRTSPPATALPPRAQARADLGFPVRRGGARGASARLSQRRRARSLADDRSIRPRRAFPSPAKRCFATPTAARPFTPARRQTSARRLCRAPRRHARTVCGRRAGRGLSASACTAPTGRRRRRLLALRDGAERSGSGARADGLMFAFAAPLALLGLLALPVIYWLLRVTPPRAARNRLSAGAAAARLEAARTRRRSRRPGRCLLLRLAIAALASLAMAGPVWNPAASGRRGAVRCSSRSTTAGRRRRPGTRRSPRPRGLIEARQRAADARSPCMLVSEGAAAPARRMAHERAEQLRAARPKPWLPDRGRRRRAGHSLRARAYKRAHRVDRRRAGAGRRGATSRGAARGGGGGRWRRGSQATTPRRWRWTAPSIDARALEVSVLRAGPRATTAWSRRSTTRRGSVGAAPFQFARRRRGQGAFRSADRIAQRRRAICASPGKIRPAPWRCSTRAGECGASRSSAAPPATRRSPCCRPPIISKRRSRPSRCCCKSRSRRRRSGSGRSGRPPQRAGARRRKGSRRARLSRRCRISSSRAGCCCVSPARASPTTPTI